MQRLRFKKVWEFKVLSCRSNNLITKLQDVVTMHFAPSQLPLIVPNIYQEATLKQERAPLVDKYKSVFFNEIKAHEPRNPVHIHEVLRLLRFHPHKIIERVGDQT